VDKIKVLSYRVSAEDFESLEIGERVKIDHFAFKDELFELCLVGDNSPHLSRDCVCSASDNGTELRMIKG